MVTRGSETEALGWDLGFVDRTVGVKRALNAMMLGSALCQWHVERGGFPVNPKP